MVIDGFFQEPLEPVRSAWGRSGSRLALLAHSPSSRAASAPRKIHQSAGSLKIRPTETQPLNSLLQSPPPPHDSLQSRNTDSSFAPLSSVPLPALTRCVRKRCSLWLEPGLDLVPDMRVIPEMAGQHAAQNTHGYYPTSHPEPLSDLGPAEVWFSDPARNSRTNLRRPNIARHRG